MIFRINPTNPRSGLTVVRLNGVEIRGVVFADEERGLVYTLRETKPSCQTNPSRFQTARFLIDETTGDYGLDCHAGDVGIELFGLKTGLPQH